MRFLVTGASGFAGPHLINRILDDGHEVFAMVRSVENASDISNVLTHPLAKVNFLFGDLENVDSIYRVFIKRKFDGVFHLGAFAHPPSSFETPRLANKTNIIGTAAICDAILEHNRECVLMNCSTPEVYGICPGDRKIDESTPMNPNNPYGVSKAGADFYVIERARTAGLRAFLTRAFSHTGPRRGSNFSISSDAIQIARIILGKQDPVIRIGNMAAKRIVADVRDVVDVYYQLMIAYFDGLVENGEIFHIAGNDLHEMQHYLDIMLEQNGMLDSTRLEIEPKFFRKVEIPVQIPDDSKVRKLLGWEPKIGIEQTLSDLVKYWIEEEKNGN